MTRAEAEAGRAGASCGARAAPECLLTAADVAAAAQLACLLEASAPKPGNVSPGRHFADTRYEDFLASAAAIGGPLAEAGARPVGVTVRLAIEATRRWTRANTNLGIVLLLTPLARAALVLEILHGTRDSGFGTRDSGLGIRDPSLESRAPNPDEGLTATRLREAVGHVLDATTVEDARNVYTAIRLASPGGLGRVDAQDVAGEPDVSLLDAMRLGAHRDGIAREYATTFEMTFETGVPALERARRDGFPWDEAGVETFLSVLAAAPDTHVARRAGDARAAEVSERARRTLAAGGVRSAAGRRAIDEMDRDLRDARNLGNPGTAADLTAAAIFVVLLRGGGVDESAKYKLERRAGLHGPPRRT